MIARFVTLCALVGWLILAPGCGQDEQKVKDLEAAKDQLQKENSELAGQVSELQAKLTAAKGMATGEGEQVSQLRKQLAGTLANLVLYHDSTLLRSADPSITFARPSRWCPSLCVQRGCR